MNASNIQAITVVGQATPKDGKMERVLRNFVHNLIRENASMQNGNYSLFVSELSMSEKKIFLSNIVNAHDYEWFCKSNARLQAGVDEYKNVMQAIINDNIDDVYHENLEEGYQLKGCYE